MKNAHILLAVVVLLGVPAWLSAELVNGIQVVVHDSVITYENLRQLDVQTEDVLIRQYPNQPALFEQKMHEADTENLEKLTAKELILHEFKTAGYNLPESIIEESVKEEIHTRYGDRVTATKTLQARGITYEKFRQQVREQIIVQAMRQKNVSSEFIISPHKVEVYYQAHQDDFKVEDEVKLRMIVLNKPVETNSMQTRQLGEEILTRLNEGASFDEMAKIYSQDSQHTQGGDRGWVERSVLRKELADAAFSLKPGQHSGVIETPDACYILLVEEARPAHCRPLTEVRAQIEKDLTLSEQKRLEKQWVERLRKKTFVRRF
jgi:peptidyl-prolyl cis-trans isomerase SurA